MFRAVQCAHRISICSWRQITELVFQPCENLNVNYSKTEAMWIAD